MTKPRIVLLHATQVAVAPVLSAFAKEWPEAETANLLDDGLTLDRVANVDTISNNLFERLEALGQYALLAKADGILVTCSAFGPAIDRMAERLAIPVVKPNEAMFTSALTLGKRIGMLATFGPSVPTMEAEFYAYAEKHAPGAVIKTVLVDNAIDILRRGDEALHNWLVADRANELADMDAVMLAHFSTSSAALEVKNKVAIPVLTAPGSAVLEMKRRIETRTASAP